ncbi:hypothetical protein JQK88_30620 [Mesorhizobium caraganae]|uniref:hypothetical protein n=1 Tax=Mesorhizobium caraganae TaxID=483206 RepID=UPI00193A3612|nr:hypothetical protein [Mesorhizobium caraganae]MBM2715484.1 hypothetical protein [Mesorhizobium caraganae]
MTAYYVRSGAAGAGTGADWTNAYTTLAAALSGKAAGDIFYVSEDHSETTAGLTLTFPGTAANPSKTICVNHSGSVPPVAADLRATAAVNSSGASTMSLASSGAYIDGVIFTTGTGSSSTATLNVGNGNNQIIAMKNCSLRIASTGASSRIRVGSLDSCYTALENTTLSFAATGQAVNTVGRITWSNTPSALLGTIPTTLFVNGGNADAQVIEVRGVDLSAAGSGKTIVGAGTGPTAIYSFTDCKLNASVTLAATPSNQGAAEIDYVRSGASGVNYNQGRIRYSGTLTEETTIVHTGGASDGTTPLAWKIVTTANAFWTLPFETPPIAIWNDITGSAVTAAIEGIWGGGAVPNNDEIWVEAEYLGDASSPLASFVNDSKANVIAAGAGQDAGSGTWGGSSTSFKLVVTFTPQQKGWVLLRVKAAKASSTFYIDPKVTLT